MMRGVIGMMRGVIGMMDKHNLHWSLREAEKLKRLVTA